MKRTGILITCIVLFQRMQSQTADEIITKHIAAIGGYEKIKAIKTMIYESVRRFEGLDRQFTGYVVEDSAIHIDNFDSTGYSGYTIITKNDGWIYDAKTNRISKKSKREIIEAQHYLDLHGPLVDYEQKGSKVKYLGKETVDGKEYFEVRLVKQNKDRLTYYFDSSYFVFRILYEPTGIYGQIYTTDYAYGPVTNGCYFPYKTIIREGQVETVYISIIVNPEIDRSLFLPHNVNKKEQYH